MTIDRYHVLTVCLFAFLPILSCQYEEGAEPVGPVLPIVVGWWPEAVTQELSSLVNRTQLRGSAHDSVAVRVLLFDTTAGKPLGGRALSFASSIGQISPDAVTNDSGVAQVWYKAAPANGIARIHVSAVGDRNLRDSISLVLSGVKLETTMTSSTAGVQDTLWCLVRVVDGLGWPVSGVDVAVRGGALQKANTDSAGVAHVPFVAQLPGHHVIEFSYSDVTRSVNITAIEDSSPDSLD